jgi:alkanesulfonate monooxygenase SsuD/methylene tetrahydromethanopterin reductase-like flavin-dependent oxidoreductase (luciferase family)
MRALLAGEEVTHHGPVRVDRARLWTLPERAPDLVGAAVSARTAGVVGTWADGLITINQPLETLRIVLDSFREAGGEGKPVHVQVHLSWDDDEDRAVAVAHDQWRSNVFSSDLAWNLEMPAQFDAAGEYVRPDDVGSAVLVSSDLSEVTAKLQAIVDLGVDGLALHHVGQEQERFIDAFGEKVLPELTS